MTPNFLSLAGGEIKIGVLKVKDATSREWIDAPEKVRLSKSSDFEVEDAEDELDDVEMQQWSRPLVRIHSLLFYLSLSLNTQTIHTTTTTHTVSFGASSHRF